MTNITAYDQIRGINRVLQTSKMKHFENLTLNKTHFNQLSKFMSLNFLSIGRLLKQILIVSARYRSQEHLLGKFSANY